MVYPLTAPVAVLPANTDILPIPNTIVNANANAEIFLPILVLIEPFMIIFSQY